MNEPEDIAIEPQSKNQLLQRSTGVRPTDQRQHILTCAARLFRNRGYAVVSLRDLATAAGVTTGSLYHHFASKDVLVCALLDQGHEQIFIEVRAAIEAAKADGAAPRDMLLAALRAHLNCLLAPDSLPAANIRIFAHVPNHLRHSTLPGRKKYERFWINMLRKLANEGHIRGNIEPGSLVKILFGAMNWSLEWYKETRDDVDELAANLLELIEATEQRH